MESKGIFVPEHEDEKWLTDLALLVDLTTHLNEFVCAVSNHNSVWKET